MRNATKLGNGFSRFAKDRSGNFALLAGIAASALALAVGFGVNIVQAYQVRTSLRSALDAAVTSTARDLTTGRIQNDEARKLVLAFLEANADTKFTQGETYTLDSLVIDQSARTVEATASAKVDIAFKLFGKTDPKVVVTSAAAYSDKKLEVAMMLDVTGSMKGRKIEDLKSAAKNAVETILRGQDPKTSRTRVAIIPYAEAVNTGDLAAQTVFAEVRGGADLPPAIDAALPVSTPKRPDACATERKLKDGSADFSDDSPFDLRRNTAGKQYQAKVNRDDRVSDCPRAELVPLTADQDKLLATITDFRASGVTAGAIAAQWGYYMLSPNWRGAIRNANLGNGPADADPEKVTKVAILMTDGLFNTAFAGSTRSNPQTQEGDRSRDYAEALCENMKTDGIQVFTIGFDLDNPDIRWNERREAKALLQGCASPDEDEVQHYFEVSTGSQLDAAFQEILKNSERLALTK